MRFFMKNAPKSAPALKLPAELWLLVFDFVTSLSIDPAGYCNHLNFPHIHRHLQFPCDFPAVINPSLHDLRLVCRYFNALLQPSQPLYMNDPDTVIPATTRELHILPQKTPQACLQRLLAHPSISARIVVLNLLGYEDLTQSPAANFDILCDNAASLPTLRALALCVRMVRVPSPVLPNFWARLNEAFPNLTCLVLRNHLETSRPGAVVELKNLEVLTWDVPNPHFSLQLPRLRHVSFGCLFLFRPELFARWPHLESLMLPIIDRGVRFDWGLFPNLRLLGLPARRMDAFPPLPRGHPLEHLYIFVGTRPRDDHNRHLFDYDLQLTWLKQTIRQMATVTRISLWFDKRSRNQYHWIEGDFREDDLELLGFEDLMFPDPDPRSGGHRVLQKLKVEPRTPLKILMTQGLAPRRISFRAGLNMFAQFISRRLNL